MASNQSSLHLVQNFHGSLPQQAYEQAIAEFAEKKLQYTKQLDQIEKTLTSIDNVQLLMHVQVDKDCKFFQKEEEFMHATQKNLSFDTAYALLEQYKKRDQESNLSGDERLKMNYLRAYLTEYQKQVRNAVSQVKNINISEIVASYPCCEIQYNVQRLCLEHQQQMLAVRQNNMQKHQDVLDALIEQQQTTTEKKSLLITSFEKMNELNSALMMQYNEKIARDTKSVILLQSLYRRNLVQQQSDVVAWRKYRAIKRDVVESALDRICNNVFTVVEAHEKAKLIVAEKMQKLLDKQEQEKQQVERIRLQQQVEKEKEALRLQEIVAAKIKKAEQRKAARQAEREKQQQLMSAQEHARLAVIAKDEAEKVLLDALIVENRRKNVGSLVTLAENHIVNIEDVFNNAVKNEEPLNKIMSVIVHYVEQFGLSNFDKKKFFHTAVECARMLKECGIPGDLERRSLILQDILQEYFESIIKNSDSCVGPCSDEQAANLAKIHNLLVDFLEDKFNL